MLLLSLSIDGLYALTDHAFHQILDDISNLLCTVLMMVWEAESSLRVHGYDGFRDPRIQFPPCVDDPRPVDKGIPVGVGLYLRAIYVLDGRIDAHEPFDVPCDIEEYLIDVLDEIVRHQTFEGHEARSFLLHEEHVLDVGPAELLQASEIMVALHSGEQDGHEQSHVIISLSSSAFGSLEIFIEIDSFQCP